MAGNTTTPQQFDLAVTILSDDKVITLTGVGITEKISDVKLRLFTESGIALNQQVLWGEDKELEDSRSLLDYAALLKIKGDTEEIEMELGKNGFLAPDEPPPDTKTLITNKLPELNERDLQLVLSLVQRLADS